MPGPTARGIIAQGQNHLEIASACLKMGQDAGAVEACRKAEQCACDADVILARTSDSALRQTLSILKLDLRITKARIRTGTPYPAVKSAGAG
jgi:hypothetical protein